MTAPERRKLSRFDATMLVMGGIIGVGIFFNPGSVAGELTELGPYFGTWIAGGVIALCGALTFARLGALFPRAGGWFVYLRQAYGPFPAFLFAWIVLFVVSTGALAVMAQFCARQLIDAAALDPDDDVLRWTLELGLLLTLTGLAWSGIKTSAGVQNAFMLVKLGAIGVFVISGLLLFTPTETVALEAAMTDERSLGARMVAAALPVLFSYGGWQMLGYTASEVRDPVRTLPRAIVVGVTGVLVVYLLLNWAYVRTLGLPRMAELGPGFATEAATVALGPTGGRLLSGAMGISAIGVLIVTILATPWIYVAMARERLFFAPFERLSTRGAPVLGLALQLVVACTYLIVLDDQVVDVLTGSVVFVEWIFHALAALAVWVFLRRGTDAEPRGRGIARVASLGYFALAVLVVFGNLSANPKHAVLGLSVIAVGALVYWPWSRFLARSAGS